MNTQEMRMQISLDEVKEVASDTASHIRQIDLNYSSLDLLHAFAMAHVLSKFEIQARVCTRDAKLYDQNNYPVLAMRIYAFSLSDDMPRDMDGNEGWEAIFANTVNHNRAWVDYSWIIGAANEDENAIVENDVQCLGYDVKEAAVRIGDEIAASWQSRIISKKTPGASGVRSLRI